MLIVNLLSTVLSFPAPAQLTLALGLAVVVFRRDIVWCVAASWIDASIWVLKPKPFPVFVRTIFLLYISLYSADPGIDHRRHIHHCAASRARGICSLGQTTRSAQGRCHSATRRGTRRRERAATWAERSRRGSIVGMISAPRRSVGFHPHGPFYLYFEDTSATNLLCYISIHHTFQDITGCLVCDAKQVAIKARDCPVPRSNRRYSELVTSKSGDALTFIDD